MKLTPWFPGNVKPTRVGVYQRQGTYGVFYSSWNGEYWYIPGATIRDAIEATKYRGSKSIYQSLPWRGLAHAPVDSD